MQQVSRFFDRTTAPHIVTLVAVAGLSALTMNIMLPSLPGMAVWFGVPYATMQLSVALYLLFQLASHSPAGYSASHALVCAVLCHLVAREIQLPQHERRAEPVDAAQLALADPRHLPGQQHDVHVQRAGQRVCGGHEYLDDQWR